MKTVAAACLFASAALLSAPASAQIEIGIQIAGRVAGSCRALQVANTVVLRCSAPVMRTEAAKLAGQAKVVTVAPAI
ncbi:hypothetical protein G7078_00150 [Sphingomonas sinipercae]|uniref:Uncharacterized protein n=1 Tax=Sphingomonas sinipercae TaxID=2714944 RepID=A0A6G7ZKC4_9SPHN|nr:hypothetical protein [Sphingomonas sinipercae]QIL01360.1 hypothetical protein G7078_00150 [Sphingomonas sinipercae]